MGLSFHAHTHCQPGRLPGDKPAKSHPWGAPLKPDVRSSRAQRTAGNLRMRSSVMTLEGASRGSGCFGQGCGKWSWRAPSAADQTGRTTHGRPKRPLAAARPPSPWPSARPLPSSSQSSQTATSDPARPSTGLIPAQPAAYNWPGSSTAQSLDQHAGSIASRCLVRRYAAFAAPTAACPSFLPFRGPSITAPSLMGSPPEIIPSRIGEEGSITGCQRTSDGGWGRTFPITTFRHL